MGVAQAIGTILRETFSAPVSGSYVIQAPGRQIVLRQGGNYAHTDLSGLNLSGLDLHGTDFSGATLRNVNLTGVNLAGANLAGANLEGAILSNVKLDGANMESTNLARAAIDHLVFETPPKGISLGSIGL